MSAARMYGHTESIAITNEIFFTLVMNSRNDLNESNFDNNYNSNGYRNNHDSNKNNCNDSNMINLKNDTILIHIKLTSTSSLCDMTIRSQSNQIREYIKNSIINIIMTIFVFLKRASIFFFTFFLLHTKIFIAQ